MALFEYVEAPNSESTRGLKVYCAGSIASCPDWQQEVRTILETKFVHLPVILYNPRRKELPIHDPSAEQARWEVAKLYSSDIVLFWISRSSYDPTNILEYHVYLAKLLLNEHVKMVCGVDPLFTLKQDVLTQNLHLGNAMQRYSGVHSNFTAFMLAAERAIESEFNSLTSDTWTLRYA